MRLKMRPACVAQLNADAGFLWPHARLWRLYQVQRRWQDGIHAVCRHPDTPHQLYLPNAQWVIAMVTSHPSDQAGWLDALGPHWAAPSLLIPRAGNSMWPTIPTPAQISVAPWSGLRIGMIGVWGEISDDGGARWVAHRVVDLGATPGLDDAVARGDNNPFDDPPRAPTQLLGRVIQVHHRRRDPNGLRAQLRAHGRWARMALQRRLGLPSRH